MKKITLVCTLLAALSAPAFAATRNCTSQLVNGGLCRDAANFLLSYDAPPAVAQRIADGFAEVYGYAEQVICDSARVTAGQCTSGQLGQQIPNPQSKAAFADARIRQFIVDTVKSAEAQQAVRAAQDAANAEPDADVGGE